MTVTGGVCSQHGAYFGRACPVCASMLFAPPPEWTPDQVEQFRSGWERFAAGLRDHDGDAVSRAYCCEVCDAEDPRWVIERWGDAVVTWACDADLPEVCGRLQRDREVTKLSVRDARKAREWAAASRALNADGGG